MEIRILAGTSSSLRFLPHPMPGPRKSNRPKLRDSTPGRPPAGSQCRALLIIDNVPLQRAAWAELHAARKQHDKVARDLHRHEQVDVPAYEAWLHRTFPVLITTLRELHQEVSTKSELIERVQTIASLTGRSPKKLWREQKTGEADPESFDENVDDEFTEATPPRNKRKAAASEDDFFRRGREEEGSGSRFSRIFERSCDSFPWVREAKAIYRRMVQRLHPDRGGELTPPRKRLWHEVQQAWAARDTEWLARLESEWETANELLGPFSPLSRLRRAIAEVFSARLDVQRKLREYRKSFPWRFSLTERTRDKLHQRVDLSFRHDISLLERQLAYIKSVIAAWENESPRRRRDRSPSWRDFG